jgi:hypothetical protein
MLALAAEEARAVFAEPEGLSLDRADTSIIRSLPIFDAIGREIPEYRDE